MLQPGPCVRALCEAIALLVSKNITCARPLRNATPSEHFPHTSHCTLHTPHSTLRTCTSSQLISSDLFSSHFMSSNMSAKFLLTIFISFLLISPKLVSTYLSSSAHQSTTSYYKACAEYFPVLLCTTKLAQTTSQY